MDDSTNMDYGALYPSYPYPIKVLENDRMKLVPFQYDLHAEAFHNAIKDAPELFKYFPAGPFSKAEELHGLIKVVVARGAMLYAVLAKVDGKLEMAGCIGYLNVEPSHLATELGFVVTAPKYQRTFVTTNACGLLLIHALDPTGEGHGVDGHGGLGLRRVQWAAHSLNEASIRAAERLGFVREGIMRWRLVLSEGKLSNGKEGPPGSEETVKQAPGRDSMLLSLCWDDWVTQRERVLKMMQRQ